MRFGNSRYRLLLAAILLVGMIPSCKSPTAPQGGSTLTLILPDSARAFDSVVFRTHYSASVKSSWKFDWQFGDSSKVSTKDTSITHVYDSAGTFTIQVTLVDSSEKAIAQQTGQLEVKPFNSPTLTLTAPDTVFWGDSCVMSVQSSQPIKPGWRFTWSLGDSTIAAGANSVLHYYLSPGIYAVRVDLNDTVHHIFLASRTAMVQAVARHFDPSQLQSMTNVTIWVSGKYIVSTSGSRPPFVDTGLLFLGTPIWTLDTFYENLTNSYSDTSTGMNGLQINQGSENGGAGGYVDLNNPTTVNFSERFSSNSSTVYPNDVGVNTYSTYTKYMGFEDLPFKSQTDSEIVFEATGPLLKQAGFSEHQSFDGRAAGYGTTDISIDWTNAAIVPRVTIIFYR